MPVGWVLRLPQGCTPFKKYVKGLCVSLEVHDNEDYVASVLMLQKIDIDNIRAQYSVPVACSAAEKPYLQTRNYVSFSQTDELVVPNGDSHMDIT
jgi:hypothetical protein